MENLTSCLLEPFDMFYDFRWQIGILGILLYWYSTWNHGYWKKKGIPYVKPWPFIGSPLTLLQHRPFEDIELKRYQKYGDLYGYFEGSEPVLVVGNPELLKDILVRDFSCFSERRVFNSGDPIIDNMLSLLKTEDWKRVRSIVSPTFSTGKLKNAMSIFQDCAITLLRNFRTGSAKGLPVEVFRFYGTFTTDVITSFAFSTKIDSHHDPENQFVRNAREAFSNSFNIRYIIYLIMPDLLRKKLGIRLFAPDNMDFFKRQALEFVQQRKKTGQKKNDLLQLLIDSVKKFENEEERNESENIGEPTVIELNNGGNVSPTVVKDNSSKRMSMDELISQCAVFYLGGYQTTAATLGLVTYLLALHPDIQEKLFKEITRVLEENGGELNYESLRAMNYLSNVVSETLRMYAPNIRLERTAVENYELGNTGLTIPKGMLIAIPIFAIHRDPQYFPDPETFNPDRFTSEEMQNILNYSYLPFGDGPRSCIGKRFALMELKVCLTYVCIAFKVKICDKTKIPLIFENAGGLMAPNSIDLVLEPRENCPINF